MYETVQVELIKIAAKWSEDSKGAGGTPLADLNAKLESFDKSYKALSKTLTPEATKPKTFHN